MRLVILFRLVRCCTRLLKSVLRHWQLGKIPEVEEACRESLARASNTFSAILNDPEIKYG